MGFMSQKGCTNPNSCTSRALLVHILPVLQPQLTVDSILVCENKLRTLSQVSNTRLGKDVEAPFHALLWLNGRHIMTFTDTDQSFMERFRAVWKIKFLSVLELQKRIGTTGRLFWDGAAITTDTWCFLCGLSHIALRGIPANRAAVG